MRPLITLILIVMAQAIFSQIVINDEDMPVPGDTLRFSITTNIPFDYTKTGHDTTWDFSALTKMTQRIDTFFSVQNTPPLYWLAFTTGVVSNLAQPGSSPVVIPGFPVNGFFTFYKDTASSFNDLGFAFQVAGIPFTVKYDNPDEYYQFPCSMGSNWSSQSSATISIPGLAYYSTLRTRNSQVDGWGTLITPFGSFQTIRVKSTLIQHDSVFLDTLGTGIPIVRNITQYKWLAKGQGEPLLTISDQGLLTTAVYRDIVNHPGLLEADQPSFRAFPNPSTGMINIPIRSSDFPMELSVIMADGKVIKHETINTYPGTQLHLNLTHFSTGIYFLIIKTSTKQIIQKISLFNS